MVVSAIASTPQASPDYASYLINNNTSEFIIILPTTNLTAGQESDFEIFGMKTITVKSNNSSVNVNETVSYFTPLHEFDGVVQDGISFRNNLINLNKGVQ